MPALLLHHLPDWTVGRDQIHRQGHEALIPTHEKRGELRVAKVRDQSDARSSLELADLKGELWVLSNTPRVRTLYFSFPLLFARQHSVWISHKTNKCGE